MINSAVIPARGKENFDPRKLKKARNDMIMTEMIPFLEVVAITIQVITAITAAGKNFDHHVPLFVKSKKTYAEYPTRVAVQDPCAVEPKLR